MFDFISFTAPRLPATAIKAARKAALDAAAAAPRLLADAQAAGEGPHYLVVHASGKRAKAYVEHGARLLDTEAFADAASTLQAWPKAALAIEEGDVFAATLVVGDPGAAFLGLARTLAF